MKNMFLGYYSPTDDEYRRLWQNSLIVLDTNVLLDLYRLPTSARDELLSVLDIVRDRLWIPYQVALEFQRRRLTIISLERKSAEDALNGANDLFNEVRQRILSLQIDKRGLGIDSASLIADLKTTSDKLVESIAVVCKSQLDIASEDPIRDRLDVLLTGRVGAAPNDQKDLDSLTENGDQRFERKIPPGFADADKEKNPAEAIFYHDGLSYHRKFGDLIIWRQILRHAQANNVESVLLITGDRKEDWWWREKGRTLGPRPELVREISSVGGVNLFWMYSSVQFLEQAKTFIRAAVTEETVAELKEVVALADVSTFSADMLETTGNFRASRQHSSSELNPMDSDDIESAVLNWLKYQYSDVRVQAHFPDFVVEEDDGLHGFEVLIFLKNPMSIKKSRSYIYIKKNLSLARDHGLDRITIVIVVGRRLARNSSLISFVDDINHLLETAVADLPIFQAIAGFVDENQRFVIIAVRRSSAAGSQVHQRRDD